MRVLLDLRWREKYFGDKRVDSLIVSIEKLRLYFTMVLFSPDGHFLLNKDLLVIEIFLFLS